MSNSIRCFMVEETQHVYVYLRRFHSSNDMEGCLVHPYKYHNAEIKLGRRMAKKDDNGFYELLRTPKDDTRWPKTCICGYPFTDDDVWQTKQHTIYRNIDTRQEYEGPSHKLPVGAMYYANRKWPFYYPSSSDGMVLALMTPGGEWIIDGIANNGPKDAAGWTRHGIPPDVVARPSIQAGSYHGWLGGPSGDQPGWLIEC